MSTKFSACRTTSILFFRIPVCICLLATALFAVASPVRADVPGQAAEVRENPEQVVVIVNGRPIRAAERDAFVAASGLSGEWAMEELIDQDLLKSAAAARNIKLPAGPLSPEDREAAERTLAREFNLEVGTPRVELVVDHAWVKDAERDADRAANRALLEKIRSLVADGKTIPVAYAGLQIDGTLWHIGDHEEYPAAVLPAEFQSLPPGSLSPIVPGDGGLHLMKIYEKKSVAFSAEAIHAAVRDELRRGAVIDFP